MCQIDLCAQKPITRHSNEGAFQSEHGVLFQELHGDDVAWECSQIPFLPYFFSFKGGPKQSCAKAIAV